MKTILVPIDFSACSISASLYAAEFAKHVKAKIILLSVVDTDTYNESRRGASEKVLLKGSIHDVNELIFKMRNNSPELLTVDFKMVIGKSVSSEINSFVHDHDVCLVVMGMRGHRQIRKHLMGSNATTMINTSTVPVITVPENVSWNGINKIIYASDMGNVLREIRRVVLFARPLRAEIHVVHFGSETEDARDMKLALMRTSHYPDIELHFSERYSVADAIEETEQVVHADMLVLFTHKVNLAEKLFGKGITRELSFHSQLPMLTFNSSVEDFAIMQQWEFAMYFN